MPIPPEAKENNGMAKGGWKFHALALPRSFVNCVCTGNCNVRGNWTVEGKHSPHRDLHRSSMAAAADGVRMACAKANSFTKIGTIAANSATFLLFLRVEMHITIRLAIISEAGNAGNNGNFFTITLNAED